MHRWRLLIMLTLVVLCRLFVQSRFLANQGIEANHLGIGGCFLGWLRPSGRLRFGVLVMFWNILSTFYKLRHNLLSFAFPFGAVLQRVKYSSLKTRDSKDTTLLQFLGQWTNGKVKEWVKEWKNVKVKETDLSAVPTFWWIRITPTICVVGRQGKFSWKK